MSGKFYITTAIDYVNDKPHLGHALEKIQADTLARFFRSKFKDTFFVLGVDEHGLKIARAAEKAGKTPQEFADEISQLFKNMRELLNLSWNYFVRTTDKVNHWPGVIQMWKTLLANGSIYKKAYQGFYCVGHEAFITEKELVGGLCPVHKTKPEFIEEENYFFKLSECSGEILKRIKSGELDIVPATRKKEIISFIEHEGLADVSFSRSRKNLSWGIPVPGDEDQVMYVWADALTNYLTAVGFGRDEDMFHRYWPADIQLVGKDILRFHAAIWPGMLLKAGLPLPKRLFVHGFITVDGQKMSKTIGNVIDPVALINDYGNKVGERAARDAFRYYLLKEIPSGEDGDFSVAKFETLYRGDLQNGIGNFASRVLALGAAFGEIADRKIPVEIAQKIKTTSEAIESKINEFKLHEALVSLWELVRFGDQYVNETKVWAIADPVAKENVVFSLIALLEEIAHTLQPFMPETSEKILENISREGNTIAIKKGEVLFPRL